MRLSRARPFSVSPGYCVGSITGWCATPRGGRSRLESSAAGHHAHEIVIGADATRSWTFNGRPCAGVQGCEDIDLSFSPATNLLPIRRARLAVGARVSVRAAWLRFPAVALEMLDQTYERVSESRNPGPKQGWILRRHARDERVRPGHPLSRALAARRSDECPLVTSVQFRPSASA